MTPPPTMEGAGAGRGVAGTLALLGVDRPAPLTHPGHFKKPARFSSVFNIPAMSDKGVCSRAVLIGSPAFLHEHLCGSASGVSLPTSTTAADTRHVFERVAAEVRQCEQARASSSLGWTGLGFVVAEAGVPATPAVTGSNSGTVTGTPSADWRALDAAVVTLRDALPARTALVIVAQGSSLTSASGDALYGATFMCVTGGSASRAASDGRDRASAGQVDATTGTAGIEPPGGGAGAPPP
jgi:hypothetical protein